MSHQQNYFTKFTFTLQGFLAIAQKIKILLL